MHGASVIALTMYDMLKPIDKEIEIGQIKLLRKKGGKSDYNDAEIFDLKASVIVCSDTISRGQKEDRAGLAIKDKLDRLQVEIANYQIIPDEKSDIEQVLTDAQGEGIDMIIYTGGTGLSLRDVTPDTLAPLMDRRIPGIEETIRAYGQERMHYAMLSRSLVGVKGKTLVIALPGSTNGAKESMEAIFPAVLHLFKIFKGTRHD
jgi:molybdenum cofactor synthesis domain-containing protein